MSAERFECVLSRGSATATGVLVTVLTVVAVGVVLLFLWIGRRTGWPPDVVKLAFIFPSFLVLLLGSVIGGSWAYSPRAVVIGADSVVVDRLVSPIVIPLATIRVVRPVAPGEFRGTLRVFGSSGLWGSMGRFHSPALGNFRMYSTDMDDAVLLDCAERIVVTPRGRDRFVAALQQRLSALRGPAGAGSA